MNKHPKSIKMNQKTLDAIMAQAPTLTLETSQPVFTTSYSNYVPIVSVSFFVLTLAGDLCAINVQFEKANRTNPFVTVTVTALTATDFKQVTEGLRPAMESVLGVNTRWLSTLPQ